MEKTYSRITLAFVGVFDHRAYDDFDDAGAYSVNGDGYKKGKEFIFHDRRQNTHKAKSEADKRGRRDRRRTVAYFIDEFCGNKVDDELKCEIRENKKRKFLVGKSETVLEDYKKYGCEVIGHRTRHIAEATRPDR